MKNVGKLERKVGGVVRPQTAPHQSDTGMVILAIKADGRDEVVDDEILICFVSHAAPVGVCAVVQPTFVVYAIGAIHFDFARFDETFECANHAVAFKVEVTAASRGKGQHGSAVVAKREDFYIAPKGWAVNFVVASLHGGGQ